MDNVPTVSDTKRAFYKVHTRPINSIYRRVVEELMVEMHLLSVNVNFKYDPIYALGVVSSYDRFMQGYRPEADKASIFRALTGAIGVEPQQYRQDAQSLESLAANLSANEAIAVLGGSESPEKASQLSKIVEEIAASEHFKYSRLFAIGLYVFLELTDPDLVKDETRLKEALEPICAKLGILPEKTQKDLELYRSNLEKMVQAQIVMEDILKADRKKRQEREEAKNAVATPPSDSPDETTSE
ncbi:photosystem II biogenesis protein Psp29 [Oscillatoriales cyanobacterium LEGE 11467]|uniref:Protein Thf1 n=1 Tax=Zarconia navalis LEGE 11467 TaxID=1828826 RepID=A0A928VVV4_9CYAN|nr:photosystem II biogenesis protein Psp29 [Zarconia navalis LEGE 11467]